MTEFDKVYQTYFSDVFLYILKLSGDDDLAEEITSETFFKAMRAIDKFRGDSDIRVWLCQIAKNTYFSYLKKHNRVETIEDIEALGTPTSLDLEQNLVNQKKAMSIHSHLHNLPEPYKEVFMLRVFGELSYRQIGNLFSKTENWACVTFYRAKNKILTQLEEDNHEQ
ncbi:MAG: sigma-70 family RNA polymerase sigma factor [Chloroflexota bacterium]|nr:sigma-70 family RNA polymerase sigma factor [Chloroflexota bacterium]